MKITLAQQLSAVLKEYRKSRKISQTDIAKKVGIRQDTVSNFENNPDSTKLDTLFKLLSAMELELEVHPRNRETQSGQQGDWQEEW